MANTNDIVIIELDRPRELRYGHKALKKLVALTGLNIDEIDTSNLDLGELEKYIYCGLLSDAKEHGETLELGQMEDLLDLAPNFAHIVERLTAAFESSFGAIGGTEGNSQMPATEPAAESGTGSKA